MLTKKGRWCLLGFRSKHEFIILKGGTIIPKTDLTKKLEKSLYAYMGKTGTFRCFEVTIGWSGKERVDFLTYNTNGVWRCYEIKVSKSDFYSTAKKTFVGHFNYYVMPLELYKEVKGDIPDHVGVIAEGSYSIKKARRMKLGVDDDLLKQSMIRSLSRDADKLHKSEDPDKMNRMNSRINRLQKERDEWRNKYHRLMNIGYEKYGTRWYKDN